MKLILKIIAGLVGLVVALVAALAISVMVTLKPNIPAETYMPQPAADRAQQHVLIFGATGKLGQEIAADLVAGGDRGGWARVQLRGKAVHWPAIIPSFRNAQK